MAALDFPASPTLNQLATLTNGFTYQWDGAVWTLAASTGQQAGGDLTGTYPNPQVTPAAKSKWQAAGAELAPVDATKIGIIMGGAIKGEFYQNPTDLYTITNSAWAPQDASKSSWYTQMGPGGDIFVINRRAANAATGPGPNLFVLDGAGNTTQSGANATIGTGPMPGLLQCMGGADGRTMLNSNSPNAPGDTTKASWQIYMDAVGDQCLIGRRAPNTAAGVGAWVLSLRNDNKTYCTLGNNTVTNVMITPGSGIRNSAGTNYTYPVNTNITGTTPVLYQRSLYTSSGGPVVLIQHCFGTFYPCVTGIPQLMYFNIRRDGNQIYNQFYQAEIPSGSLNTGHPATMNSVIIDLVAAGAHTYEIYVYLGNTSNVYRSGWYSSGDLFVYELL